MTTKTKEEITEKQAAGYFWKLVELNAVPIITWDLNGQISHANNAFLDMLGYSRKEFEDKGINWKEISLSGCESVDEHCIHQLKQHDIAEPFEKKYRRKDGTSIKVRLYNAVLEAGQSHGIAIVLQVK